ncbi:MAG: helix-turn-helix transcriptional regulator [Candidatus Omnitrophica bacterium]|nr:helix-turn-helix transcriptional regulator [Candidatus Omnitrophota bacterium]
MNGMLKVTNKLKGWLELREWDNTRLAKELNYSDSLISLVLNGEQEPSKQMMKKLCFLTGLDVGDLFFCDRSVESKDS